MWLVVWVVPCVIVVAGAIHAVLTSRPFPSGKLLEIAVIHSIFWGVGVMSVVVAYFVGTEPSGMRIAAALGWPAGNPFQTMAAGRILAFGIGGIGVVWFRGGWIVAMTISSCLFGWGTIVLWAIKDVPAPIVGAAIVYNVVGGLILIALVVAYRWRAGAKRFWTPMPYFGGF